MLPKYSFSGAADGAMWASLVAYALQTITKLPASGVAATFSQSLFEESRRNLILEMLKFLFFGCLFSSILQYILIRWSIHAKGFRSVLKTFDFTTIVFNAFMTRIFLKELGLKKEFSICSYMLRYFPSFLKPLLAGSSICNTLSFPLDTLSTISYDYLNRFIAFSLPAWNFLMSFALIFKPLLLLTHYVFLSLFFLSFLFVEPVVLFSEVLAFIGNFAAYSDIMSSKASMFVALVFSAALTLTSLVILYNCTILGADYVLPAEIGLCVWLLVFFCCTFGLFKIFLQKPDEGDYLWTLPQFACLLAYQTSTVLAICEIASVSGHISPVEHWHAGIRIGIFNGICVAIRLICQALLLSSIVFAHLVAYCPDFVERLTFWIYPSSFDDDIPEEATSSFFLLNMSKGLWIFSKPIFIGLLYIYLSKRPKPLFSTISNFLSYPSWLTLASLFANLVASVLLCMYFLCVHDPVSAHEDQEAENFLAMINSGSY